MKKYKLFCTIVSFLMIEVGISYSGHEETIEEPTVVDKPQEASLWQQAKRTWQRFQKIRTPDPKISTYYQKFQPGKTMEDMKYLIGNKRAEEWDELTDPEDKDILHPRMREKLQWDTLEDMEPTKKTLEVQELYKKHKEAARSLFQKKEYYTNIADSKIIPSPQDVNFLLQIPDTALHSTDTFMQYLMTTNLKDTIIDFNNDPYATLHKQANQTSINRLLEAIKNAKIKAEQVNTAKLTQLTAAQQAIIDEVLAGHEKLSSAEQQEFNIIKDRIIAEQKAQLQKLLENEKQAQKRTEELEALSKKNQNQQQKIITDAEQGHYKLSENEQEKIQALQTQFLQIKEAIQRADEQKRAIERKIQDAEAAVELLFSKDQEQRAAEAKKILADQKIIKEKYQKEQQQKQFDQMMSVSDKFDKNLVKNQSATLLKAFKQHIFYPTPRPDIIEKFAKQLCKPFDAIISHQPDFFHEATIHFLTTIPDQALKNWQNYSSYLQQNNLTIELNNLKNYTDNAGQRISIVEFQEIMKQVIAKVKEAKSLIPQISSKK